MICHGIIFIPVKLRDNRLTRLIMFNYYFYGIKFHLTYGKKQYQTGLS